MATIEDKAEQRCHAEMNTIQRIKFQFLGLHTGPNRSIKPEQICDTAPHVTGGYGYDAVTFSAYLRQACFRSKGLREARCR